MKLKKISNLVHEILINEPACRNSDNILYWRVLQVLGTEKGIDVSKMSVPTLLFHMREYGLPSIESVGRARRKIQEHNPELSAEATVEAYREVLEDEYREYARLYTVQEETWIESTNTERDTKPRSWLKRLWILQYSRM